MDPNLGEPTNRILCALGGPKNGTARRSHFWDRILIPFLFSFCTTCAGQFLGPPGGPIFGTVFRPNFAGRGFFPLDQCSYGRCAFRAAAFAHQHGRDLAGISLLWIAWNGIEIAD